MFEFLKRRERSGKNPVIVAGLGNPGPEYERSRHNCGFRVIDVLSSRHGISVCKHRFKSLMGEGNIPGRDGRIVLLKPNTFMNLSGESIRPAMSWYKCTEADLIVIYDDIDLEAGTIRIRTKGSAGSHNGMKSVLQYTDSDCFTRVRIGIGKNPSYMDLKDYVLGKFNPEEEELMEKTFERAADAVEMILKEGADKAMSHFNGKA